jgi:hypothetical protein
MYLGRALASDRVREPLLQALDLPAAALEQIAACAPRLKPAALGHELPEPLDQGCHLGAGATRDWHPTEAAIPGPDCQGGLPELPCAGNRTAGRVA